MSTKRASVRSAGWISLCSLAQLVVQFLFQVLLADEFGTGEGMDAYYAAIGLPTVLTAIVTGPLSYALVPVFSQPLQSGDQTDAWRSVSRLGTWLITLTFPICLAIRTAAGPLTQALYPGFVGLRFDLTVELLQVFCWLLLTNLALAYLQTLYHCCQRFLLPAISPVISTSATLFIAWSIEDPGIRDIAWAVLAGSVIAVGLHLPIVFQHLRPNWKIDDHVRHAARLMLPLIAGALYFRIDPQVDNYLASGLEEGSVAHVGYAWRIASALVVVGTSGLSIVVFPSLAGLWKQDQKELFRAEVALAMRCLCGILVPIVVAVSVYARPLIADLYERGAFLSSDTISVSQLLVLYLGMVVAAGFGEVTAKVFFAIGDTRTPVTVGVIGFTIGVLMKLTLTPMIGVSGLVSATSLYYLFNITTMTVLLLRRLGREIYAGIGLAATRASAASFIAVGVAFPVVRSGMPLPTLWGAATGLIGYVAVQLVMGDELVRTAWNRLRGKNSSDTPRMDSEKRAAVSDQREDQDH